MATNSNIFITALEARQNPFRERVVHEEGRSIESAVLSAVEDGLYECVVSDGTPMTQSTPIASPVMEVNEASGTFFVPNHAFKQGDTVNVSSTQALPSPLTSTSYYYVIYVDPNHIKLASSLQNALRERPIPLNISNALTSIEVTNEGSGYLSPPVVTLSGGDPQSPGSAIAYLGKYGNVSSIAVVSGGNGYTDVPTIDIVPQGSGATAGTISFKMVQMLVSAGGSNYRVGDVLVVGGGVGISASATVTLVGNIGNVLTVSMTNPGSYTTLPTMTGVNTSVTPGGGTGCTLDLVAGILSIAVGNGGTGYTSQPKVVISSGSGSDAEATAIVTAGTVSGISVTNAGSGYLSAPTVTMTSGAGATAIAIIEPAYIGNITLINDGGNTYTSVPNVSIITQGFGASAGQAYMRVSSAKKVNSGVGYRAGDVVLIAGGAGSTGATIQVLSVGTAGEIIGYVLATGGLYRQIPVLENNNVMGGTGTAATFDLTVCLDSVDVANGGSGYVAPPVVTVVSNSGYGAQVIANIEGGSVTSLDVIANGAAFEEIPSITITGGSGASATAHLAGTGIFTIDVTNGGSGYNEAQVNIGGNGIGASATAQIVNGTIIGIIVDVAGSGYTYPPPITITGDGYGAEANANIIPTHIDYIEITSNGDGYTSRPLITIEGDATAKAILGGTGILRIDVVDGGADYTSDPIVSVIPGINQVGVPISPSTWTTRGYSVDHIAVVTGGIGYTSAPDVNISAPQDLNGEAATATASIGVGAGTMTISLYPASKDYYAAWKGTTISNSAFTRPYVDRMDTIIAYFTDLGYVINRQTNPATGNTIQWAVKW